MSMVYTHDENLMGLKDSMHFCNALGVNVRTDAESCRWCGKRLK